MKATYDYIKGEVYLHKHKYEDIKNLDEFIAYIKENTYWQDSTEGTLTLDNGLLYNWYAVNTSKLAPTGWLVASYDDWSTLVAYIGGENCGYKLKARGAIWGSVNSGATDEFNFSAVGAGFRILAGAFFFQRVIARFWTSTLEIEGGIPYYFDLEDLSLDITSEVGVEGTGHSVRCVRTASTDELLLADGTYCEEVVDASGNSYRTVKIGTQVWMAENLKTTKYNDDTDIPNITNNALWEADMAGAYCSYSNDVITVYDYESPLTIKPTKGRYVDIDRILETVNKRFTSDVELANKIDKTTDVTAINDTSIADGHIALFNKTNKDIRTSSKTIVTTLGADDTTVPTSKAVKDVTDKALTINPDKSVDIFGNLTANKDVIIGGVAIFSNNLTDWGNSGATKAVIEVSTKINTLTLTDNCELTMPEFTNSISFVIKVTQDATGGRSLTIKDSDANTMVNLSEMDFSTGTANQKCWITVLWDGTEGCYTTSKWCN